MLSTASPGGCGCRFLTLFSTSLPSETVARVWDSVFNEGSKALYRVALALLKVHEEILLKCDNAGRYAPRACCQPARLGSRAQLLATGTQPAAHLPCAVRLWAALLLDVCCALRTPHTLLPSPPLSPCTPCPQAS